MPDKPDNPFKFWEELKRRKVVRVITVYAAASFVILELVDILSPSLGLPPWMLNFVLVLLCVGFIISTVLSWVYDITPDGIHKTKPSALVSSEAKQSTSRGWKISTYISGLVIVAFIVFYIMGNVKQSSDIANLEKTIAVLPFENFSYGEEYSHYGNSISNEIISELSKIGEFNVKSYTSSSQYKPGNKPPIPQIGRELGVNFIIEGSLERQGNKVNIHVQIIQVNKDDHIRAREFDGKWEDIHSIQDDIALTVANELKTLLSPEEIEQIEKIPTENLQAFDLYLKGRYNWNLRTEEGLEKSIDYFMQAIEMDENYALAYSGLADVYFISADWNYLPPDSAYKKARLLALESIFLDNKNAEPYATLGMVAASFEIDDEFAELYFKQSLQINPNYSSANQWYAIYLSSRGRFQESFRHMERALETDPNSGIINYAYGFILYEAQDYDKALIQLEKTSKIDTGMSHGYYKFLCYLQKGLYNEMITEYENILKGNSFYPNFRETANNVINNEGMNGLIRYIIDLEHQTPSRYRQLLPILHTSIGNKDKALDILEIHMKERVMDYYFINVEPGFMDLHSEPRFKELLKMIGMQT